MLARKALAGTAGAPKVYVEDVFSTYLYTGNGSTQTITNNIDLSTEGGLVWIKQRDGGVQNHALYDTARGARYGLCSNTTDAQTYATVSQRELYSFGSTGFSIGPAENFTVNDSGTKYASWTFRKAKKFFDIVTYTGNGTARTISHNLGSVPGCIIVKDTTNAGSAWAVYHRSIGNTKYLQLQSTGAEATSSGYWNNTTPTSTEFTVGTNGNVNQNGATFVAYLFAHDAGGFGDAGSDSIIKCGSFTTDGSGNYDLDLGWEPQWYIQKPTGSGAWWMTDTMRGFDNSPTKLLQPHTSNAEYSDSTVYFTPTATGNKIRNWAASTTYIYIAIRRGPMKTPTSGTSVFTPIARTATSANATVTAGFAPDLVMNMYRNVSGGLEYQFDRLRGPLQYLATGSTAAEGTGTASLTAFNNTTYNLGTDSSGLINLSPYTTVNWVFGRAPGFFDVVCYTGTGSATTFSHNLGVAPQLMIVKCRSTASTGWIVYDATNTATNFSRLDTTQATSAASTMWNNTSPTASVFSVGTHATVNNSSDTYVAYLFASLSGVSKVGSYTGNGSSVTVTTDFQPRFILVKRTDSTGNWIVGDSARGLVSADEPALFLNSTAAETTGQDWVDVSSTGFTVNETALNANVNTGTYIYLAIA